MMQLLEDLPLDFVITGKEIVIKAKPAPRRPDLETARTDLPAQQQSTTGRVLDEQGNPLEGAAVRIKGTTRETSTDNNGRFTLNDVEQGAVLLISFVGYETKKTGSESV